MSCHARVAALASQMNADTGGIATLQKRVENGMRHGGLVQMQTLTGNKLVDLLIVGVAIFGGAWLYAWSVGCEPLLAVKVAGGALAPWILGKATDADKAAPSVDNIKALVGR